MSQTNDTRKLAGESVSFYSITGKNFRLVEELETLVEVPGGGDNA